MIYRLGLATLIPSLTAWCNSTFTKKGIAYAELFDVKPANSLSVGLLIQ